MVEAHSTSFQLKTLLGKSLQEIQDLIKPLNINPISIDLSHSATGSGSK